MGKFTEFNVPLRGMADGVHHMQFHLGEQFFANMENTDIHGADVTVDLDIECRNDRFDLRFKLTGEVVLLCDRCLDDLHWPIDTDYRILVEYGSEYNDDSDELLVIPQSDANLNVAYMIYDTVVLAIPIKHVHPLGKCNRQMSALLRKHRAAASDEDAELENALIDEMDSIQDQGEEQ